MTTIQMLEDAIHERIAKENAFKDAIVAHINEILSKLPVCTTSNTTPEVSNTVHLSKTKLASILQKIGDYSSINENAAKELIAKLNLTNVRKPTSEPRRSLDSKESFDLTSPENFARLQKYYDEPEQFHYGGKRTKSRRR
jgi:hypothetical protein